MIKILRFVPGFSRVLSNIVPLAILLILSKFVETSDLGLISYFASIITLIGVITDFGLPEAIQRMVKKTNQSEKIGFVIGLEFTIVIVVSALVFILDLIFGGAILKGFSLILVTIFILSANNIILISFNAIERYFRVSLYYLVSSILFFVLVLVFFALGIGAIESFLYGRLLSWGFVFLVGFIDLKNITRFSLNLNFDKQFFKYAIGALIITGSYVVLNNWDSLLINNVFGSDVNGYYRSATILGSIPLLLITIISTRYLPYLSEIWGKEESKGLIKSTLRKVSTVVILLLMLGFFIVLLLGSSLLELFYTKEIAINGYMYFLWGYVNSSVYVIGAIASIYLYVSNGLRFLVKLSLFCALCFVLLSTIGALTVGLALVPISLLIACLLFTITVSVRVFID